MILRKPYAFLIRHFRLIHVLLCVLLGYICYRTSDIYSYFLSCVRTKSVGSDLSVNIVNYLLVILALMIFALIMILMNRKKKPSKYYLFAIIFYMVLMVSFFLTSSQLYNIYIDRIDSRLLNITRDLLMVTYYGQFVFIVFAFVRATGFNIKKFDFQRDLKELSVLEEDNEEFELDVAIDVNDVKTKFKRYLRIGKYVVRENKTFVTIVVGFACFYVFINLITNIFIYNKVYGERKWYDVNELSYIVLNSYETRLDYKGNIITKQDKKFVVVETMITNNGTNAKQLNTNYIKLKTDKNTSYMINPTYNKYFVDLGVGYKNQYIKGGQTYRFLFVYMIPGDTSTRDATFEVLKSAELENNEYKYKYARVSLNLKDADNPEIVETKKLKETVYLNDTLLKSSSIKIDEVEYSNYATYEYKDTINGKEYTFNSVVNPIINDYYGKIVMKIKAEEIIDGSITSQTIREKIFENFVRIRYEYNGTMYTYRNISEHITSDDEHIYIDVPSFVKNSKEVYLDIIMRDKGYSYKIK